MNNIKEKFIKYIKYISIMLMMGLVIYFEAFDKEGYSNKISSKDVILLIMYISGVILGPLIIILINKFKKINN